MSLGWSSLTSDLAAFSRFASRGARHYCLDRSCDCICRGLLLSYRDVPALHRSAFIADWGSTVRERDRTAVCALDRGCSTSGLLMRVRLMSSARISAVFTECTRLHLAWNALCGRDCMCMPDVGTTECSLCKQ